MKIIKPSYEILTPIDYAYATKFIEEVGRTCYKSEDKITDESAEKFVRMLIGRGHEAMIEHYHLSVKFICDRGISHEIVRHRIASFAQESTRYCNYDKDKFGGEITVIEPHYLDFTLEDPDKDYYKSEAAEFWRSACLHAESAYMGMIKDGKTPQEARAVLPNSLKTEIIMTANLREWRHFLKLRAAPTAHPQIVELAKPLLEELKEKMPAFFEDITV